MTKARDGAGTAHRARDADGAEANGTEANGAVGLAEPVPSCPVNTAMHGRITAKGETLH